jgi:hypothetical protein
MHFLYVGGVPFSSVMANPFLCHLFIHLPSESGCSGREGHEEYPLPISKAILPISSTLSHPVIH